MRRCLSFASHRTRKWFSGKVLLRLSPTGALSEKKFFLTLFVIVFNVKRLRVILLYASYDARTLHHIYALLRCGPPPFAREAYKKFHSNNKPFIRKCQQIILLLFRRVFWARFCRILKKKLHQPSVLFRQKPEEHIFLFFLYCHRDGHFCSCRVFRHPRE